MKKIDDGYALILNEVELIKMRAVTRFCVILCKEHSKQMTKVMQDTGQNRLDSINMAQESEEFLYNLMNTLAE